MSQAFRWDGEAMRPLRPKQADEEYVVGAVYWLEPEQPRSPESHRHQFAWLDEAWTQLPENLADLYPSPEHLRKRALIEAGYYDEEVIDVGSNAAALRVAQFVRHKDDFAHVVVRGPLVVVHTAKSQSRRRMKKPDFQASKSAIMEIVAGMIGVSVDELKRNAGMAA